MLQELIQNGINVFSFIKVLDYFTSLGNFFLFQEILGSVIRKDEDDEESLKDNYKKDKLWDNLPDCWIISDELFEDPINEVRERFPSCQQESIESS